MRWLGSFHGKEVDGLRITKPILLTSFLSEARNHFSKRWLRNNAPQEEVQQQALQGRKLLSLVVFRYHIFFPFDDR